MSRSRKFMSLSFLFFYLLTNFLPISYLEASAKTVTDAVYDNDSQLSSESTSRIEDYNLLKSGQKAAQARQYYTPQEPTVYLSFDDGPSYITDQILNLLKEEEIQATFFVLGQAAEANPERVQRIVEEGHALGNHTYNHNYAELYQDFNDYWQQIQQTERILYHLTGLRPKLVRTPGGSYGHLDPFYFYFMDQAGYQIYDWNVDSGDAKRAGVTAEEMIQNVKNTPLKHEMHVLMHDSAKREETVKALPEIIAYYKSQGYRFAPMDEQTEPVVQSLGPLRHQRAMDWLKFEQTLSQVLSESYHTGRQSSDSIQIREERIIRTASAAAISNEQISEQPEEQVSELASIGTDKQAGELAHKQVGVTAGKQTGKQTGELARKQASVQLGEAGKRAGELAPRHLARKQVAESAGLQADERALTVTLPGVQFTLNSDEYELVNGRLYVSLRQIHELAGGEVFWKQEEKTAVIQMGLRFVEYNISERTAAFPKLGSKAKEVVSLPSMYVEDGTIMMSLRDWVEHIGLTITEVEMGKEERKVTIAMQKLEFYV